MDNNTTKVDYILSVQSTDVDEALKKLKLLEKETAIANRKSLIRYRNEMIADKKSKRATLKRHYERMDENTRINALAKKYDTVTKRKLAKSTIDYRYKSGEALRTKATAYAESVSNRHLFNYDKLAQQKTLSEAKLKQQDEMLNKKLAQQAEKFNKQAELKKQELDRKDFEASEKAANARIKNARLERESIEKNIRDNEKITNIRLETARKEKETEIRYKYLNKREDNRKTLSEAKLKQQSYNARYKEINASKKLQQADERLALAKEKLAMQTKQQARLDKLQRKAGRGSRRPFESMMMALGSFMLIQYAVQMPFMWASALGDAMANVEMESRKGKAYRSSLQNRGYSTTNFDKAVQRYSEISGEQGYLARARLAKIYGMAEQSGQNISNVNPEYIANALQGMTVGMGMSDEQADKKLAELLSGKISKEDRKMFGIKSRTPMQVLEEINTTMQKNPVIASTLKEGSATADMKFIRGAKSELLSRINDLWGGLFQEITRPMKEFIKTFFGLDNKKVLAEWITTLSTIRDNIEKVFTKKNAEKLATFISRFVSGITMLLGTIAEFSLNHPLLSGIIAGVGLYNKSKTGSVFVPPWLDKYFGDKANGQRVFVTNMPKSPFALQGMSGGMMLYAMKEGLVAVAPYIGAAIAGGIVGYFTGKHIIGPLLNKYQEGKSDFEDSKILQNIGLSSDDRKEYFIRKKSGEVINVNDYLRQKLSPEQFAKYYKKNIYPIEQFNKDKFNKIFNNTALPLDFENDLYKSITTNNNGGTSNITNNYNAPYGPIKNRSVFDGATDKTEVHINATNLYMNGKDFGVDYLMNAGGAISYAY